MHDRFNNWLVTVMLIVGITGFVAIGVQAVAVSYAALTLECDAKLPPGAWENPGPFPDEQRSWADLFAACRLDDAWLGADIEGEPVCYPMRQTCAEEEP